MAFNNASTLMFQLMGRFWNELVATDAPYIRHDPVDEYLDKFPEACESCRVNCAHEILMRLRVKKKTVLDPERSRYLSKSYQAGRCACAPNR